MSEYFYVIFQKLCQDIYLLQDPGGFSEQKKHSNIFFCCTALRDGFIPDLALKKQLVFVRKNLSHSGLFEVNEVMGN